MDKDLAGQTRAGVTLSRRGNEFLSEAHSGIPVPSSTFCQLSIAVASDSCTLYSTHKFQGNQRELPSNQKDCTRVAHFGKFTLIGY